jgi:hypothetical protein
MNTMYGAPWHQESFDRFLQERLPELLSQRLPLAGYSAEFTSETTARVTVSVTGPNGEVTAVYDDLPRPDAGGLLWLEQSKRPTGSGSGLHAYVIVPIASSEDLDTAEIACIGEQLHSFVEGKLGAVSEGLPWDDALLRAWLPLDIWVLNFTHRAQWHDTANWLSRHVHPRRIYIPNAEKMFTPGHVGRVCPLTTPEGPNVGKVVDVAAGATIENGRLVIVDDNPDVGFGISAHMIPFIEHSSDARLMMSCNMMRQWMPLSDPEPALVQTGCEPDAPDFWCGRNLLTAYCPWGADTFEDSVVVSESCARRFTDPRPLASGDRLSNRHGAKCKVSRILPDIEMPHLNGVPAEIVFSPAGVTTRLNIGQLWECIAGRIAQITGEPVITPLFHGPAEAELRAKLKDLGLPEDGLDKLTRGNGGPELERPSLVGWVYWGRRVHSVETPVRVSTGPSDGEEQGVLEYEALRRVGAYETILEHYNIRSAFRDDADTLAKRLMQGPVLQASDPSRSFDSLAQRLARAGIQVSLSDKGLSFELREPAAGMMLARPVSHPWLRGVKMTHVGSIRHSEQFNAVALINQQLERLDQSGAPESLVQKCVAQLEQAVSKYLNDLVGPSILRRSETVTFTGRAISLPGADLELDQVGIPDSMAWGLFGPQLTRETGDASAVANRTPEAAAALDALMARSWVLLYSMTLYYSPEFVHTPLLACHPVRLREEVIRIPTAVCSLMNTDFDDDQLAILLPITEAGQREAGELLTARAYLERDPNLLENMRPCLDSLWGLASLSLTDDGRQELLALLHAESLPSGLLTKQNLLALLEDLRSREGLDAALEAAERLRNRGFEAARQSGWSMGPFFGHSLSLPPLPEDDSPESWSRYTEEVTDVIVSKVGFADNDTDPFRLAMLSGARGNARLAIRYVTGWGTAHDADGSLVRIAHGYREGITSKESLLLAYGMRKGWYRMNQEESARVTSPFVSGFHVLARAMRAEYPGAVFARAAAAGEIDPLTDLDSRLFVGLMPE